MRVTYPLTAALLAVVSLVSIPRMDRGPTTLALTPSACQWLQVAGAEVTPATGGAGVRVTRRRVRSLAFSPAEWS